MSNISRMKQFVAEWKFRPGQHARGDSAALFVVNCNQASRTRNQTEHDVGRHSRWLGHKRTDSSFWSESRHVCSRFCPSHQSIPQLWPGETASEIDRASEKGKKKTKEIFKRQKSEETIPLSRVFARCLLANVAKNRPFLICSSRSQS